MSITSPTEAESRTAAATSTPATTSAAGRIASALTDLRRRIDGVVLCPGEEGYDAARTGFNLAVDQHPSVIVVAATADDVAEAVRFAALTDRAVAVQATGHGPALPADDAVLVVTSRLDGVRIDPQARTAYVEAGARWGAVLRPAAEHGLAPLLGSSTGVGAIGYTLGGGMGWLARRYGLSSDAVLAFDLVTPDGIRVRASRSSHPEVFWALRGGGAGSLGVVVGMLIRLFPVTEVYAGTLFYPAEFAAEVLQRWRTWVRGVSEELTSAVAIMNFPPLEAVPEPLRGRSFVLVRGCWSGEVEQGKALIDTWRSWRQPVLDLFGPMPFAGADQISNDPTDPMPAMVTSELFDTLPDEVISTLVHAVLPAGERPPVLTFAEVRQFGGAIRRNAHLAANDRARQAEFCLEMVGVPMDAEGALLLAEHLRVTQESLRPFTTGAAYLNFLEGEEKQRRTADAFSPAHLARLRAVKRALDPDERFSHGMSL